MNKTSNSILDFADRDNQFNLAFFSSSEFCLPILQSVLNAQGKTFAELVEFYQLDQEYISQLSLLGFLDKTINFCFICSQPDSTNRSKTISNPVVEFARNYSGKQPLGIATFLPQKLNLEYQNSLEGCGFEFGDLDLAITASFGQIVSQKVLDLPKYGFINWHPSTLPLYRGATPMQTCLANGDNQTALSWIEMTKGMDSGGVLLQKNIELYGTETFNNLAKMMGNLGQKSWFEAVCLQLLNRKQVYNPTIQDETKATFCSTFDKSQALISLNDYDCKSLYNRWRGMQNFPGIKIATDLFGIIKILEISGYIENYTSDFAASGDQIRFESLEFIQTTNKKTYLKTKNGVAEITKIMLENGKTLDLRGKLL